MRVSPGMNPARSDTLRVVARLVDAADRAPVCWAHSAVPAPNFWRKVETWVASAPRVVAVPGVSSYTPGLSVAVPEVVHEVAPEPDDVDDARSTREAPAEIVDVGSADGVVRSFVRSTAEFAQSARLVVVATGLPDAVRVAVLAAVTVDTMVKVVVLGTVATAPPVPS
ncbi:unannotated protein [freshwater metagenome]|uniref:Unannotated protein n=1 Tax=freshwater metagenome TaxID=449393 RepID=A0A6J7KE08_9ZZZZ